MTHSFDLDGQMTCYPVGSVCLRCTSVDTLRSLQVPIPGGRNVALSQFTTFEYGQEYALLWRRNREPTLTVRADTVPGALPDAVVAQLEAPIAKLQAALPKGYRIELGGIA